MAKLTLSLLLNCLFFFFLSLPGAAQNSGGGIKAGTNLSNLSGTINYEANFKFGPSFGVFGYYRPTRGIAIQPEIIYSVQGSKNTFPDAEGETRTTLQYLNIPLILKVNLTDNLFWQIGPQLGILINAREKGTLKYYGNFTSRTEKINTTTTRNYIENDFSIVGGFGINITPKVVFSARYAHGFLNIDNDSFYSRFRTPDMPLSNRVFEFAINYNFWKDNWQTPENKL